MAYNFLKENSWLLRQCDHKTVGFLIIKYLQIS